MGLWMMWLMAPFRQDFRQLQTANFVRVLQQLGSWFHPGLHLLIALTVSLTEKQLAGIFKHGKRSYTPYRGILNAMCNVNSFVTSFQWPSTMKKLERFYNKLLLHWCKVIHQIHSSLMKRSGQIIEWLLIYQVTGCSKMGEIWDLIKYQCREY